jgi:hypothetical protein
VSLNKPQAAGPTQPIIIELIDVAKMDLHLQPDIDPKKGIRAHKAFISLRTGLTLHGITIARGLDGHVKIDIPEPCPLTNSAGVKLLPATFTELQRALVQGWLHDRFTERLKERRMR